MLSLLTSTLAFNARGMLPSASRSSSSTIASPAISPLHGHHRAIHSITMIDASFVADAMMMDPQALGLQALPEFADLARAAPAEHHARFSDIMMQAVGTYILISGGSTFWPRIKAKITGIEPQVSEEAIMKYLDSLPTSTFAWHNADLRNPLPDDVSALDTPHRIGVHNGRKAFLYSRSAAIHFAKAELSEIFTEHFKGEKVYIGYEYIGYEKA